MKFESNPVDKQWEAPYAVQCAQERPRTYKIRQHANGKFTCIGYNFMGTRVTYGTFDTLLEAQNYMLCQFGIEKAEWEQTKGKRKN